MAIFIAKDKRLRLSNIQFENFHLKTEKESIIKQLKKGKYLGIMYDVWEEEIDIPLEYVKEGVTSISFDTWEEYKNLKIEKELLLKGNEQQIVDMIINKHKAVTIRGMLKNLGYSSHKHTKLDYKTWLLGETGKGKISLDELKKMYFFVEKFITEEEYEEKKKEELEGKDD